MAETDPVGEAMNDARLDLGIQWQDVATRAGVGLTSLHRFRKAQGPRTPEMTRKIERVFGWPRGYLDAIAAGKEPPPIDVPAEGPIFAGIDVDAIPDVPHAFDRELAELRAEARQLLARADEIEAAMRRRGAG